MRRHIKRKIIFEESVYYDKLTQTWFPSYIEV